MTTLTHHEPQTTEDLLQLNGTDYVEFYVGNARQASYFYRMAMGFSLVAYAGPETGQRDRASYVLQQGKIRFVLTTPLRPDNEVAEHIRLHGDGVRDVALWVDDAKHGMERDHPARRAQRAGAVRDLRTNTEAPRWRPSPFMETPSTPLSSARIITGRFCPGTLRKGKDHLARPTGLLHVDHVVGNVGWNEMNRWVDFYATVMGFSLYQHFDDKDISTEYSALMSKVMANGNGRVKFPLNEPAEGRQEVADRGVSWNSTTGRACSILRWPPTTLCTP